MDGKCTHRTCGLALIAEHLIDRIKKLAARINGKKRRFGSLRRQSKRNKFPASRIEPVSVDPFTPVVGIRSNVKQMFLHRCSSRGQEPHGGERGQQENRQAENVPQCYECKVHTFPLLSCLPLCTFGYFVVNDLKMREPKGYKDKKKTLTMFHSASGIASMRPSRKT